MRLAKAEEGKVGVSNAPAGEAAPAPPPATPSVALLADSPSDIGALMGQTDAAEGLGGLGTKGAGRGGGGYGRGQKSPLPPNEAAVHMDLQVKEWGLWIWLRQWRHCIRQRRQHFYRIHAFRRRTHPSNAQSTESYTDYGVNPFTKTAEDALSTFSIDVDTASYTIARRKINAGALPPMASVRAEEFINYFDYDYASTDAQPFDVHVDGMVDPFRPNHHIVRVGVQGKELTASRSSTLHLTFLVDVSGSMSVETSCQLPSRRCIF